MDNQGGMAMISQNQGMNLSGYVDPAAVAAAESVKAAIQAQYMVAMGRPRNEDQARFKILEACKRPGFAEKVEYSLNFGKSPVKGPTIRLAELILREWGNVRSDIQVVHDDDSTRRVKITLTDLQSNTSFGREVVIQKVIIRKNPIGKEIVGQKVNSSGEVVFFVKADDSDIRAKEAAEVSKILRNEGLRLVPKDIIEEALIAARTTMLKQDKTDPDAARRKILDAFLVIGVQPKDLEAYLGHNTSLITPDEVLDLRGVYSAIKDGEAKWVDYVDEKKGAVNPAKDALREKAKTQGHANGTEPEGADIDAKKGKVLDDIARLWHNMERDPETLEAEITKFCGGAYWSLKRLQRFLSRLTDESLRTSGLTGTPTEDVLTPGEQAYIEESIGQIGGTDGEA